MSVLTGTSPGTSTGTSSRTSSGTASRAFVCVSLGAAFLLLIGAAQSATEEANSSASPGAGASAASGGKWIATWAAAPLPPGVAMGPRPGTPQFENQTIRQIVHVSAGGTRVRIRFTNEFGTQPLSIGAARIAPMDANGAPSLNADRALTFAGNAKAVIPPGAPLISDPVDLPVKALSSLAISAYFPGATGLCTCHDVGMQTAEVSGAGEFTHVGFPSKTTIQSRAFLSGVEVETAAPAKVIAVLGDSISDGVGSTPDTNRRWPDLLAERLAQRDGKQAWGMANLGISGNRLLADGAGQNALSRFNRDILAQPGLAYVIVFLGVNDLGVAYGDVQGPMAEFFRKQRTTLVPTSEAMIAGYRQLIDRAHAAGVKIIGATIAPYEGALYYSANGERVRQAVNQWMRTSHAFDGVLDFDAVLRDPAKPTQLAAKLHAGDHLHGSDAGYQAVAQSIDLTQFK